MNNRYKYYKVLLKNIFNNNNEVVYVVFENGKYYELLTNKEIFMVYDKNLYNINNFLESNCKLLGFFIEEIRESDVALYLKFITSNEKDNIINEINNMEKSFNDRFNEIRNNKVKRMTKEKFLKNY